MKVANDELYELTNTIEISIGIFKRRWRWIGHILRKENDNNSSIALTWTPEGRRRRGRPKLTWRRMIERERNNFGWRSWGEAKVVASNRKRWKSLLNEASISTFRREER